MKKGVFVHSYNVNERNWLETVWGTPPDKPGRLVRGISVFLESRANLLILIGSAIGKDGKSSGEWMRDLLYQKIAELPQFSIYPVFGRLSPSEIKTKLDRKLKLIPGPEVRNTADELKLLAKIFKEAKIEKIVLVSSPDHMSRILKDAFSIWQEFAPEFAANFSCSPCVTLYTDGDGKTPPERAKVANVVIAEPRFPLAPYFQRMFGIANNPEALAEIDAVLKKYNK